MQRRFIRSAVVVAALVGLALPTGVQAGSPGPIDITSTARGQELATTGAARSTARGVRAAASDVRVWQLAPGEFLLGKALPANLRTSTVTAANGQTTIDVSYDVGMTLGALAPRSQAVQSAAAKSPSWLWLNQACFSRISNYYGWLDSCYVEHGMINESDPRDFYQLEQWGTLGAKQLIGKYYSGGSRGSRPRGARP